VLVSAKQTEKVMGLFSISLITVFFADEVLWLSLFPPLS